MIVIGTFLDATAVWSPVNGKNRDVKYFDAVGRRPDGGIDLPSSSASIKWKRQKST